MSEHIRILRVLEYSGPRAAVEAHMQLVLQGQKTFAMTDRGRTYLGDVLIKATTLGVVPDLFLTNEPDIITS